MSLPRVYLVLASSFTAALSMPLAAWPQAQSAILFIGDGMGISQVTAARIFQANARDGKLTLDTFDQVAIVRTYAANTLVTDSAAAGTALASGRKTNALVIGESPGGQRLENVLELAKAAGKSVGIVTNTTVTHATPACFYAHINNRSREDTIAEQLTEYGQVDLVMGGGRRFFLPKDEKDPETGTRSRRTDGRDLLEEARAAGYRVVMRQSEFDEIVQDVDAGRPPGKLLALFSPSYMAYEVDRGQDPWGEPSITEMTVLAIRILKRNPNGFFLMIEGGRIDHGSHDSKAYLTVTELLEFDKAIKAGLDLTQESGDTLIVVTADHETGGLAINGYPPIEVGGVALFTTPAGPGGEHIVTFATGPGADRSTEKDKSRSDPHYRQPALFKAIPATHSGADVLLWASGPGAETFKGTMDNSEVGKNLIAALGLN